MTEQKLNQVIAIENGTKTRVESFVTALYHLAQKPSLFSGMTRKYRPLKEGAERLPQETQLVQQRCDAVLEGVRLAMSELFDVAAARDFGNCVAKANVIVDGETLLENVPATYLLFLEKKLVDLHTIVTKLPVLDPAESWTRDSSDGLYKTNPAETARTAKVPKPIVLYDATPEHPAQTQIFTEDVIIGYYEAVKMSGALPALESIKLQRRIIDLQKAVKFAREQANMTVAPDPKVAEKVLGWLFKP